MSRRRETNSLARLIRESKLAMIGEGVEAPTPDELPMFEADAEQNAVRCARIIRAIEGSHPASLSEPLRMLEFGLGYGFVTLALSWRFKDRAQLFGVDHPQAGLITSAALATHLDERSVTYAPCDLMEEDLPWPEVAFDVIVVSEVIEHVPPTDLPVLLEKMAARLAPGGRLVISSPNLHSVLRRAKFLLGQGPMFDAPFESAPAYHHIVMYGKDDMERMVNHLGLELTRFEYLNWEHIFVPVDRWSKRLHYSVQRLLPLVWSPLSTSWLLVASRAPSERSAD